MRAAVVTQCFDKLRSSWETYFGKLKAFKERFGDCRVKTGWDEDPALWNWVSAQRGRRYNGNLSSEQIRRLDELGFIWDWQTVKADEIWMEWYRKLEAYQVKHQHCKVPQRTELGRWVAHQRADFKRLKLSQDRIDKLNLLKFEWNLKNTYKRIDRLAQLRAFRVEHGHCRVEHDMKTYPGLAVWVRNQCWLFNKGKMPDKRVSELNAEGFDWQFARDRGGTTQSQALGWEARFAQLQRYKEEHRHCRVPDRWKGNPSLAKWVSKQRQLYKKRKLRADRIARLEGIGFEWDLSFKPQTANA